jgi:hypothetical protein
MKLKKRPGPTGAVEPVKKKIEYYLEDGVCFPGYSSSSVLYR